MAEYSILGGEINTLENSLKMFGMECLLEQLDNSLELVRRNKITDKQHLDVLKSVDKNLLKLSRTIHPDKAINERKSLAQAQQAALNATREVLQTLTKAFLKDIHIYYRYEFFAKTNISSLNNENEMDRQIDSVLCKISLLSEVKRVSIVGEIRKFLLESRKSLISFQADDKDEFERHRDLALRYLHRCIEGYGALATECELIIRECRGEHDESARSAMQKTYDQSQRELNILKKLERVAEKSLDGPLQIFSTYEPKSSYDYYIVSPFVLYINVMLMCTAVINRKSGIWKAIKAKCTKVENSSQFSTNPVLFLKAYHLASYFDNKAQHERDVGNILHRNNLDITSDNIVREFKDVVKSIEVFLEKEFDINTYKEGKSNREQFVEKLSKLNESLSGYREVEKELQEKINFCRKETDEIRKEYFKFSEKIQETESRENILKSKEITELISGGYQKEGTRSKIFHENKTNKSSNEIKEETTEIKLVKRLEQYEESAEKLLAFLADCRQNVFKFTSHQSSFGDQNKYSLVITEEVEKRIEASYELNKKINEQLFYFMIQNPLKFMEEITKRDSLIEENSEDTSLKKSNYTKTVDEIKESSGNYDIQFFDSSASEQNITHTTNVILIEDTSSYKQNTHPFQKVDHGELSKKQTVEETFVSDKNGKPKKILDQKVDTKMVESHVSSNEQHAEDRIKHYGIKKLRILKECNKSAENGKEALRDDNEKEFAQTYSKDF